MTRSGPRRLVAALVLLATARTMAQAPDGNAILRAAGMTVPRGGAEEVFDSNIAPPTPVPATAFPALVIGMGPIGPRARVRNAYAFGVLAGRSGRHVPLGVLAGAGVTLMQMMVADERSVRIAGARVAGRVFAAPIDGLAPPPRSAGLPEAAVLLLNAPHAGEQRAALEAVGLIGETAAVPTITELYFAYREKKNREMAGAALAALTRIGHADSERLARNLAADDWGAADDEAGLAAAFARARYLKDGSRARLEALRDHRELGPTAQAYLAELDAARP